MKHIMSISLDEETIIRMREVMRKGPYRNKSHVVEEAIRRMADES